MNTARLPLKRQENNFTKTAGIQHLLFFYARNRNLHAKVPKWRNAVIVGKFVEKFYFITISKKIK
ncbi:hypothetical protein [uncultured Dialister sp.]|uniref:hypothetical protein n=1 Tax=uncultured Dialister sp. TaxID=278064 RepID=UPI0027DCB5E0|nr:hypothetical protein [uncultured Dialister sp.]